MKTLYSSDLEMRVLQTLMQIGSSDDIHVKRVMLQLDPQCFYRHPAGELFLFIKKQFIKNQGISFIDILDLIPRENKSLVALWNTILDNEKTYGCNIYDLETDADKLITYKSLRKQMDILNCAVKEAYENRDAQECHALLNERITEAANIPFGQNKSGIHNTEIADQYYDGALQKDLVIETTCEKFNRALKGGVRSKSLITVAGAPAMGKTGYGIFLMDSIARTQLDKQALFFSLEMESKHIWMRHSGIRGNKKFEEMNSSEQSEAIVSALMIPLTIYDLANTPIASDIDFILTTSRIKAMDKPISVIVVDYLGLVESKGVFDRPDLKQTDITTKLARLAIELNCVVIALSQVNRAPAQRDKSDRCPYPSDAADSSGSHKSSTLWLGIDRPETYQDDFCYQNQFVVKCRKNRFGENFELIYGFNGGTFGDYNANYYKKPFSSKKNHEEALFS